MQRFALILVLLGVLLSPIAMAQQTGITYQGQLQQAGAPFTGLADLEFTLHDSLVGGNPVAGPISRTDVPVEDGLFQIELDFGPGAFGADVRFLEIRVDGTTLSPRQRVQPTPMALFALGGNEGPAGPAGPSGPQGPEGDIGPEGPAGIQGPAGDDGAQGPEGVQGPEGPAGPAGADGAQGPEGAQGPQGPAGPTGADGAPGTDGAQGPEGPAGPAGADGAPGSDGAQGPQGPAGPAGADGAPGTDGAQGPQGPAGPAGADGAPGTDGAQGPQGPAGPTGADGAPGSDGAQGPQGPVGPAGADGAPGSDGAQGPQGPAGSVGPQGPTGAAGPTGPPGATGPQGPPGPQLGYVFLAADSSTNGTRNFSVTDGRLALVDFFIDDQSPDVSVQTINGPGGLDFSRINILTTGAYELSYDTTWRAADASPPVLDFQVFLTAHGGSSSLCSDTVLATAGPPLGVQRITIRDSSSLYSISGTHVGTFEAGACIALRALEGDPTSGNNVRLDIAQVVIKRLQ